MKENGSERRKKKKNLEENERWPASLYSVQEGGMENTGLA